MKTYSTHYRKTYVVTPTEDGTITTPDGVIVCSFTAGVQQVFVAPCEEVQCSDDDAIITLTFSRAPFGLSSLGGGTSSTTTTKITSVGVFFATSSTSIYGKRFAYKSDGTLVSGHYDASGDWVDDTGLEYCTYLAATSESTTYTLEQGSKNDFDSLYPWREMKREEIEGNSMVLVPKFALRIREQSFTFDELDADGQLVDQVVEAGFVVEISTDEDAEAVATGVGDWRVSKAFMRPDGSYMPWYGIGCYEASQVDSALASVSGVAPKVSTSRANFTALARALNSMDGYDDQSWSITSIFETQEIMIPLMWVESACRSSQAAFGAGLSAMSAATNAGVADCINYYYPAAPLRSGNVASSTTGTNPIVYRGIENPWGNVWKNVHGLIIVNATDEDEVTTRNYYVQTDNDRSLFGEYSTPELLEDNGYESLTYETQAANGYVTQVGIGQSWEPSLLPTGVASGGSSTVKYADYQYISANEGFFTPFVGGGWSSGAYCGFCYWHLSYALGNSSSNFGARLSCAF